MGFDVVNMSWDYSQDLEIRDVRRVAEKYVANAAKFTDELILLESKINKLTIICRSMMDLLDEHDLIDKETMSKKINELATSPPKAKPKCTKCGSVKSRATIKFKKCMLCGHKSTVNEEMTDIL